MSEQISAAERMKQHFSNRVINQVRQVLELWRHLPAQQWSAASLTDFTLATEKLARFAQRFDAEQHALLANELLTTLSTLGAKRTPTSEQLATLNEIVVQLSQTALRQSDQSGGEQLIPEKKPVYIALSDTDHALVLAEQMQYFGLIPELHRSVADFNQALLRRHPAAVVVDLDFHEINYGITLAEKIQQRREQPLPILFTYQQQEPSIEQRLAALRTGGLGIYPQQEVQDVIRHLEDVLDKTPQPPMRILIVDDSRAQAMHSSQVLNKAGLLTEMVNDPLQVLSVMTQFEPDLVLMDMYMPGCNGMELAKVIRQQREYLNLPIIYLSGEEDRERQLAAMAEGGDDFLTKPVEASHLITTVTTRVKRARQLHDLIIRDSLTGLLNHTHTLETLQNILDKQPTQPVCFIMVDIDHFKNVNDQYGHPVGDVVIKNLALFLRQRLRKSDPIGRYGGEEFALILQNTDADQAVKILDNIRQNFSNLIHDSNSSLQVTFSCGVAQWHGQALSQLVEQADQALYEAKHRGRNCVCRAG